jgi:hypothetical protein
MGPDCSACEDTLRQSAERDADAAGERSVADRIAAARSGGRDLPESVRSFFEPRFGREFDDVSIHTGPTADAAARAIDAEAFTLGTDIVFRSGTFRPETRAGKRLIGHELTHVVQQGDAPAVDARPRTVASPDSSAEREADRVADRVTRVAPRRQGDSAAAQQTPAPLAQRVSSGTDSAVLHRKLTVADPSGAPPKAPAGETNESIVEDYVEQLCSEFTVESGEVTPKNSDFCGWFDPSPGTESCECLCEMHELGTLVSDTEWTIEIDDSEWPHSNPATNTVSVHSPYSGMQFGSWTGTAGSASPHRGETDNWLILAHELCGHVLPIERENHPAKDEAHGGRRHHDFTIRIENEIAREHGIPSSELRGLFSDPHHGESLASVELTQFPIGGADVGALPKSQQKQIVLAKSFIDSASVKLDVIGHAGPGSGTSGENTQTSLQRAQAVRDELVSRGVDRGNIMQVTGVGDRDCSMSGRVPSCRKVEIYMFSYEGASGSHGP